MSRFATAQHLQRMKVSFLIKPQNHYCFSDNFTGGLPYNSVGGDCLLGSSLLPIAEWISLEVQPPPKQLLPSQRVIGFNDRTSSAISEDRSCQVETSGTVALLF